MAFLLFYEFCSLLFAYSGNTVAIHVSCGSVQIPAESLSEDKRKKISLIKYDQNPLFQSLLNKKIMCINKMRSIYKSHNKGKVRKDVVWMEDTNLALGPGSSSADKVC